MQPFNYYRASRDADAVSTLDKGGQTTQLIAGGTTLLDLMKLNVISPNQLVDISKLSLTEIEQKHGSIVIGALARNSDVAHHKFIQDNYPILSQALLSGASPQLRNMATVGGNIMQRSRCPYFRDTSMACNKRQPGSGCPAIAGYSRMHAIFGVSEHCIAAHPSDMCVALAALDAVIHVRSVGDSRKYSINDFYLLPEDSPERETQLKPGELIVAVEIPASLSRFKKHSHYLKVRDRSSFSFALVSVAACLDLDGSGKVRDARIVLGGVGVKPWRVAHAERMLIGHALSESTIASAAAEAIKNATPQKYNKFKVELTKRSVIRAIETAAGVV